MVQWIRFRTPNAGGPGSMPGQETRSHMHTATKSSHATTKEPASLRPCATKQINKKNCLDSAYLRLVMLFFIWREHLFYVSKENCIPY